MVKLYFSSRFKIHFADPLHRAETPPADLPLLLPQEPEDYDDNYGLDEDDYEPVGEGY